MSNIDRLAYNRAGQLFCACNTASANHVAVTTSMTGFILYNPLGSTKTLYIMQVSFVWVTAPAAVHNLMHAQMAPNIGAASSGTAVGSGVQSCQGTGNAGNAVGLAYHTLTLPVAPVARMWFGGAAWGSAVAVSPYCITDYVDGALAVPPGGAYCVSVVTTTAAGMTGCIWLEI